MTKKAAAPSIRFKGFSDAWEQRKFNEVFDFLQNNALSRAELTNNGKVMNVHYGDILVKYGEILDITKDELTYLVDDSILKKYQTSVLRNGDIIIADAAEDETVGKCSEIVGLSGETVLSGLHTIPCRPTVKFAEGYLGYYMNSGAYHNQLLPLIQGTKISSISKSAIQDTEIDYPKLEEEQAQIGTYFKNLDHLITLHQRKYEKLTNVKKSMLEKMFPQNGSSYPEIRFKGFTDPWEQRKVGDFYDFKNGLNKGKAFFGKGTPIVNFTDVFHKRGITTQMLRGRVTLTPSEISNYGVKQGDIFVTRTSETIEEIGYASVMLDSPKDTVFSGFVLRGRAIKEDPLTLKFKQFVFSTDAFRSEMIKKSSMTTRALTSGTAIKKMYFQYPVSTEEQNRIGQFLESLDHLITLHQRELEKLQNIKKSMLEKMFV